MAFPDVFAVMSNPSRMGTPLVSKVARVRVNRATADFAQHIAQDRQSSTGVLSMTCLPLSVL